MAGEIVGSASVRIEPDTSGLESALLSELQSALNSATEFITSAFQAASTAAGESLAEIGSSGFDSVTAAAEAASASIEASFADVGAGAGDSLAAGIESSVNGAVETAKGSIEGLASDVPEIDIPVVVDTDQAQAALSELGSSAGEAGGGIEGLEGHVKGLEGAVGLAEGSAAGLGSALANTSGGAAVLVGGITALAGAATSFFKEGLGAESAAFRLDQTFGSLADTVRQIDVGTLSGSIEELGLKLGTTDDDLENAASKIGQLGKSAGAALPDIVETTDQILALALRARALNPALGDAGDIAERMTNAFARGGRALAPFNVLLTAAEINQRALSDTSKQSATELTIYEKAAAGAALATEQLGDSLKTDIETGANNPTIQLAAIKTEFTEFIEALGRPLVLPILDSLQNLIRVAEPVGTILAQLVTAALPFVDVASRIAVPLTGLANILDGLNPDVVTFAGGLALVAATGLEFTAGLAAANPILAGFGLAVGVVVTAIEAYRLITGQGHKDEMAADVTRVSQALKDQSGAFSTATDVLGRYIETSSKFEVRKQTTQLQELGLTAEQTGSLLIDVGSGFEEFGQKLKTAFDEGDLSATQVADLIDSFKDEAKAIQDSAKASLILETKNGEIATSFLEAGAASGDYVNSLKEGRAAADASAEGVLTIAAASGTLNIALRDQLIAANTSADGLVDYTAVLDGVRQANLDALQAQESFAANFATLASSLPAVAANYVAVSDGIGIVGEDLVHLAESMVGAGVGTQEFATIAAGLGVTTEQLQKFVQDTNQAVSDFVGNALKNIPGVGDAFDAAAEHAKSNKTALSGKDIADALDETLAHLKTTKAELATILGGARSDLAAFAVENGPEAIHAIATASDATIAQIRTGISGIGTTFGEVTGQVTQAGALAITQSGQVGALMLADLGANFNPASIIPVSLAATGAAITANSAAVTGPVTALGTAASAGFQAGFVPGIAAAASAGASQASTAILAQESLLYTAGFGTAGVVSQGFTQGLGPLTGAAQQGMAAAAQGVTAGGGTVAGAANTVGTGSAQALAGGFAATAPGALSTSITVLHLALTTAGIGLSGVALTAGRGIGISLGSGIAVGIGESVSKISAAAANAVDKAEAAARKAADSHSPSKLFAEVGNDLALGLAFGIEDGAAGVADAAASAIVNAAGAASSALDTKNDKFKSLADSLGVTSDSLAKFFTDADAAVDQFVTTAVNKLPSVGSAFDAAAQKASAAHRILSGQGILSSLQTTVESIKNYSADLTLILGSAYKDLASFAAKQGPDAVKAIANSLRDNDQETLKALRDNIVNGVPGALDEATALLQKAGVNSVSGSLASLAAGDLAGLDPTAKAALTTASATSSAKGGDISIGTITITFGDIVFAGDASPENAASTIDSLSAQAKAKLTDSLAVELRTRGN